jgi:hypothetical protein
MNKELEKALTYLLQTQNQDGGWSYYTGKNSSLEPTIYSVLALAKSGTEGERAAQRGLDWLASQTKSNGALSLPGQKDDHWTTLLYLIPLVQLKAPQDQITKVTNWILEFQSKTIGKTEGNNLDGTIVGWSWAMNTFGWVEPTSYGVLALKLANHKEHNRVKEGVRFILDRVCTDGGWNYGNREVLGQLLTSYISTSAYALMALQNEPSAEETCKKGIAFIQKNIETNHSALNLSLAILSLDLFGQPTDGLLAHLSKRQLENGSWRDNTHLTALSALAIRASNKAQNSSGEAQNVFRLQ